MPARPYKPKDKAKAEVGVQIVERWILARLRHQTFFSLAQVYHQQQLVASHPRKTIPGISTLPEHMPERHSKQQRWTPGRLKQWAADIGPGTLC